MNPRECPYRGEDAQDDVKPMNREQRRKAMKQAKGMSESDFRNASDIVRDLAGQLDKCGIVEFFYTGILGDFSRALVGYRITHGMSRNELADRLGVSMETLRTYEGGYHDVPLRDLVKACLAIGFRVKIEGELRSRGGSKKMNPEKQRECPQFADGGRIGADTLESIRAGDDLIIPPMSIEETGRLLAEGAAMLGVPVKEIEDGIKSLVERSFPDDDAKGDVFDLPPSFT